MQRSKKSLYNMIFGVANQIIVLAFGLIVPRIFIVNYGSEVNGLQSSIAYIYTYIALLESGIGTATIQALFGALSRNNRSEINSILSATNIQYKKIAKIYFACMLVFSVVYPFTVSTSVDKITVAFMVLLSGVSSLVSFVFYGKFMLLLQADGRSYITSSIGLFNYISVNIVKIALILAGFPFIAVYVGSALLSVIMALIYFLYKKKYYSWLDLSVKPNLKAISQSKNVLVHQISNIVCNSTDVLVLTYIVRDLKLVSVYNIYIMIFDAVKSLIMNIFSSVNFIMGQTYNSDIKLYRKYHHIYEILDISVSFALYSVAYVMMNPFLEVYTQGISDVKYVDKYLPLLFALIKLLYSVREPSSQLINYAGHFRQTQWRSVAEAALNIVISVVCSIYLGIYGVLLGTVAALLYRTIDMYVYTSKRFLNRSVFVSVKQWIIYLSAFAVIILVNGKLTLHASGYIDFFIKAAVCAVIISGFYAIVTCIFYPKTVRSVIDFVVRKALKKKVKS